MKKILPVIFFIFFITVISSLARAAEFGSNSANMSNAYLPAKIGIATFFTGFGDRSL